MRGGRGAAPAPCGWFCASRSTSGPTPRYPSAAAMPPTKLRRETVIAPPVLKDRRTNRHILTFFVEVVRPFSGGHCPDQRGLAPSGRPLRGPLVLVPAD